MQKGCPKYCDECIEYYDDEIISKDKLCKRCSEDFYPLQKSSDEQFYVRCYPNDSSPNGYFFYEDGEKSEHRACYETCAKCNQTGDFSHHLCEECDTGFTKIEEEQDNCFPICSFFYYYTIYKKYKCTEEKKCPKEYPYLILENNKCIDYCKNDNTYKFTYNNKCFQFCPNGTHESQEKDYKLTCVDDKNSLSEIECSRDAKIIQLEYENITNDFLDNFTRDYIINYPTDVGKVITYSPPENSLKEYLIVLYKYEQCAKETVSNFIELELDECINSIKKKKN